MKCWIVVSKNKSMTSTDISHQQLRYKMRRYNRWFIIWFRLSWYRLLCHTKSWKWLTSSCLIQSESSSSVMNWHWKVSNSSLLLLNVKNGNSTHFAISTIPLPSLKPSFSVRPRERLTGSPKKWEKVSFDRFLWFLNQVKMMTKAMLMPRVDQWAQFSRPDDRLVRLVLIGFRNHSLDFSDFWSDMNIFSQFHSFGDAWWYASKRKKWNYERIPIRSNSCSNLYRCLGSWSRCSTGMKLTWNMFQVSQSKFRSHWLSTTIFQTIVNCTFIVLVVLVDTAERVLQSTSFV